MEIRAYQRSAAIEESDLVVKKRKNYYADLVFPSTYLVHLIMVTATRTRHTVLRCVDYMELLNATSRR